MNFSVVESSIKTVTLAHNAPVEVRLHPQDNVTLFVTNLQPGDTHVLVQAHTQWDAVTLSQDIAGEVLSDNTVTGSHVGLVRLLQVGEVTVSWQLSPGPNVTRNISLLLMASIFDSKGYVHIHFNRNENNIMYHCPIKGD